MNFYPKDGDGDHRLAILALLFLPLLNQAILCYSIIKTLFDLCKTNAEPTVYDLGFVLGPRINAGGRVGKSSHGAELLICRDAQRAYQLASELDKYNKERQSIETLLSKQINQDLKKYHNHPVLVVAGSNWHEGVIGIIASRIKDKYNKPTILISIYEDHCKGSARSIVGFDIGAHIINAVQLGLLEKGGGHKMAGGFTIKQDKIEDFRDFLIKKFEKNNKISSDINLYLDTIISPSALNTEFFSEINFLSPYGSGNNEPKFVIEKIKVIKSEYIKNTHIKSLLMGKDGSVFKSFAWNAINTPIDQYLKKENKKLFNIAGKMKLNEWKGKKNIEFIIEDISED